MLSLLIPVYGWDGEKLPQFSYCRLGRPVLGSGAWALNDNWATNISAGLVVVGTVLATTSAANSLFPGVALDRFAIVNIVAAAIVAAAPVVFGILTSVPDGTDTRAGRRCHGRPDVTAVSAGTAGVTPAPLRLG